MNFEFIPSRSKLDSMAVEPNAVLFPDRTSAAPTILLTADHHRLFSLKLAAALRSPDPKESSLYAAEVKAFLTHLCASPSLLELFPLLEKEIAYSVSLLKAQFD